jgi:hypothetical protein
MLSPLDQGTSSPPMLGHIKTQPAREISGRPRVATELLLWSQLPLPMLLLKLSHVRLKIGSELLQRKAHIFIRFMADHYRPDSRPNHVYVINYKTSTRSWEPLFDKKGNPLYPQLMAELDAMKQLRPTGGLMLRRDGSGLPWSGKGEMLTQVERISKRSLSLQACGPSLPSRRSVGTAELPNLNRPD